MKIELAKIAFLQMGYSFRSRLESSSQGNVKVIQMKDLDENRVNAADLVKIELENIDAHLVKCGDLIFRSRGQITTSAIVDQALPNAIVAAPLIRIRVKEAVVLPDYLNWYLHQDPAQNYFSSQSSGTAQQMISKKALEEMDILLPPLTVQTRIIEFVRLAEKEHELECKLAMRRKLYAAKLLLHVAEGD